MRITAMAVTGCCACLVTVAACRGDGTNLVLDLDACVRLAMERSGTAENARREQDVASARVVQARSEALPQLSLGGTYLRNDKLQEFDFGGESVEIGTLDNYNLSAGIKQKLYTGGKIRAALLAARLNESYAAWERLETESGLVRDVRLGFNDVLLAGAAVSVREESVRQLEQLLSQTEHRRDAGTASDFDVLRARVRVANERPELIRSRNMLELARESFRRLIGQDEGDFRLKGVLPEDVSVPDDTEAVLARVGSRRPLLRMMADLASLREQDIAVARSTGLPTLSAQYDYQGANTYGLVTSGHGDWEWHWTAALVLQWDIWNGGLTQGTIDEKRLRHRQALTELEESTRSVRLETRQAFLDASHAGEAIEAGQGTVALAEEALRIVRVRHEAGLATFLEYTDAAVALSTARLSYLQALHDRANAVARLEHAAGLLPVWLREAVRADAVLSKGGD